MKNLYCIVGPSGSGKTTLVNSLCQLYGGNVTVVESYTTRSPRYEGETGHLFVSDEEFDALGPLCAYTEFDGHRYGVPSSMIDESDLYVIDPAGVEYLKNHYDGPKEIRVIGLYADPMTLRARMKKRGDSDMAITHRIANDARMFKGLSDICDHLFRSDGIEATANAVKECIDYTERSLSAYTSDFTTDLTDIIEATMNAEDSDARMEQLIQVFTNELDSDEEPWSKKGYSLLRAMTSGDTVGVLMALCGWGLRSLMVKACLLRDEEDLLTDSVEPVTVIFDMDDEEVEVEGCINHRTLEITADEKRSDWLKLVVDAKSISFTHGNGELLDVLSDLELPDDDVIHAWIQTV